MADENSYKQSIVDAENAVQKVINKVKLLQDAIVSAGSILAEMNKSSGGGSASDINSKLKSNNEVLNKLKATTKEYTRVEKERLSVIKALERATKAEIKSIQDKFNKLKADSSAREAQINKESALRQRLGAQKKRESAETLQQINKEVALRKSLESQKQRELQGIRQANSARLKEADAIEGNKQALLSQKNAALKLNDAYNKLGAKQKEAKRVLHNLLAAYKKNIVQIKKAQREYDRLTAKVNRVNKATSNFTKTGLGGMARGFRTLVGALGIAGVAQLLVSMGKSVFNLAKTFDALGFAMKKTSKNAEEAAMTSRFLLSLSKDLGLELISTTNRFIKFAAAARNSGVAMKDTQKIFGTMAKAGAVLGLKTDELGGIFLALEQMLSKGKVTTEELRRQLGERLPGAFGIMAASLGVTLPKLDEMLRKGELLSADVLPGFADAVEVAFGLDTVNKIETLVASQNRMTTAWQNFVKGITEGDSSISRAFKSVLDGAAHFVNSLDLIFNKESALRNIRTQNAFKQQTHDIKANSKIVLDSKREEGNKLAQIEQEILNAQADLVKKTNDELADERLRLAVAAKIQYNKELSVIEQKDAEEQFSKRYAAVLKEEKKLEDLKKLRGLEPAAIPEEFKKDAGHTLAIYENIEKAIESQTELLERRQGVLDATRLIAEKTKKAELDPDEDDIKKGIDALKGSVKWHKAQIAVMVELRDSQALSTEAYDEQTEAIEKYQKRVKIMTGALRELLSVGKDSELGEVLGVSFGGEDAEFDKSLKSQNDKAEASRNKRISDAEIEKQRLESLKEAFLTVTDTFSDAFDIDMSKFDFIMDSLADKEDKLFSKDKISEWADLSKELIGSVLDASMNSYDVQLQEAIRTRDMVLNDDLATEEQKRAAKEKFEEEEAKIKNARAKEERKNNLIKIAVDTAVAVVKTFADLGFTPLGIAAASAMTAIGIGQGAIVASQPLPKFAEGTENAPKGWAITQERRAEPITDKYGRLKTMGSDGGDALTYLEQGDKVFKSKDALFSHFDMNDVDKAVFNMNMESNGNILSKSRVDNSLLNEMSGMRGDMDKMGKRMEKIASRPIKNSVTVEIEDKTPY